MLNQIPELMEMALILKIIHLRENFMGIHLLTSLAQISKTLIVSKPSYSKIMHFIENCLERRLLI